jgi:transposase
MSKTFRPWDVDQIWLLLPSIQDLVPRGHIAHFVRDTVRTGLDLSCIMDSYDEERGFPPYHPGMMVALLLYAYSQGVYSSRKIARGCEERLDIAAVTGMQRPDFRTISEFRKRHLAALSALFHQVLKLCREAGLVKLGHVALDGTKIKANAGINKAMSYGRMKEGGASYWCTGTTGTPYWLIFCQNWSHRLSVSARARRLRTICAPSGVQRIPEQHKRCLTRVLHAASVTPDPIGIPFSRYRA